MISIVIPVYNAEKSIHRLTKKIFEIFLEFEVEVILVNDCSIDKSHQECLKTYDEFKSKITYIKLGKNVGEHNATMAGLKQTAGDWILIMDDDFQNPPEEGLKLVKHAIKNNYDVTYADYEKKKHSFLRNLGSKINDNTANYILKKPKNLYLSSFKCIKKSLLKKIEIYQGPYPYIDGLVLSVTSNIGTLKTNHEERKIGKSGYSFLKLFKLYANIATNFSTVPIHFFSIVGLVIALCSSLYGIYILLEKIFIPSVPIGYSSILTAVIFLAGIQLIFLGLIGEYVGKILKMLIRNPNIQ